MRMYFERFSLFLILVSIVVFTLETVPELKSYYHVFRKIEVGFVLIFGGEYLFRIWESKNRKQYIFSFFGIVDFLSVAPFFLSLGFADFSWLRILRVLRIFGLFRMPRFIKAIDRIKLAFYKIKEELFVFSFIASLIIYLSAVGIYYFEHPVQPEKFSSILHSLWWAIATLTTVGYGDVYPVTAGGKTFTGIILLAGVSLISIPSGLLASSFGEVFRNERNVKSE